MAGEFAAIIRCMSWIILLVSLGAVWSNWGQTLAPFAIAIALISIWMLGIAANFRRDPQSIPNFVAIVSMLSFLASIVLIVLGFFVV